MSISELDKDKAKVEIINWIDHILNRKHWKPTELAERAEIAPSTILRLLKNKDKAFLSTFSTMSKIAKASGYPIPNTILQVFNVPLTAEGDYVPSNVVRLKKRGSHREEFEDDEVQVDQAEMIPLRYVSTLPVSIHPMQRSEKRTESIPRLKGDSTAFAFYMPDNSMAPMAPTNSLMYATKDRDPGDGDLVLVIKDDKRSLVRILVEKTEEGLTLARADSSLKSDLLPYENIQEIAVVVGMSRT